MSKQTKRRQQKDKKRQTRIQKEHRNKREAEKRGPVVVTPNGKMIGKFMSEVGEKGSYKDFVIITDNRLVDYTGSCEINRPNRENDEMALVHKRDLHKIIGEESKRYWDLELGKRIT